MAGVESLFPSLAVIASIQVVGVMVSDEALIEGNKVTNTGPVGPGSTQYQIVYTLPVENGGPA